ncbi:MAG: 16S rRNA (guanine(527)-N(7))-methyltransferase RsmG, partial [Treponema sp.]|nr:16S rRNA (guanine(527)-N(7))-methyltransferase RsmG [Treponema sp.]
MNCPVEPQEPSKPEGNDTLLEAGIGCLCAADPDMAQLLGPRTATIISALETYIQEIERFNPVYKLVGARNREELVVKHLLDSLCPLGIIFRLAQAMPGFPLRIADAGSGAGLPGIPLAISLAHSERYRFTLIERMGRRAGFLRTIQAVLGLRNVVVEEGEMEKAAPGRFQLITFRAFRPLEPKLLKGLFRLLAPGGALLAYKGREAAITAELSRVEAGIGSWERIPLTVPFLNEERHLLVLRD